MIQTIKTRELTVDVVVQCTFLPADIDDERPAIEREENVTFYIDSDDSDVYGFVDWTGDYYEEVFEIEDDVLCSYARGADKDPDGYELVDMEVLEYYAR